MAWTKARVGGLLATAGCLALVYAASWRAMMVPGIGPLSLTGVKDGVPITITLYEVAQVTPPDRYRIRRGELSFEVQGPTEGLVPGQELTVHGALERGVLVEEWRAEAPLRAAKKALGFLGLAIVAGVALGTLRWRHEGLRPRG